MYAPLGSSSAIKAQLNQLSQILKDEVYKRLGATGPQIGQLTVSIVLNRPIPPGIASPLVVLASQQRYRMRRRIPWPIRPNRSDAIDLHRHELYHRMTYVAGRRKCLPYGKLISRLVRQSIAIVPTLPLPKLDLVQDTIDRDPAFYFKCRPGPPSARRRQYPYNAMHLANIKRDEVVGYRLSYRLLIVRRRK